MIPLEDGGFLLVCFTDRETEIVSGNSLLCGEPLVEQGDSRTPPNWFLGFFLSCKPGFSAGLLHL